MKGTFIIHLRADEKCIWVQLERQREQNWASAGDRVKNTVVKENKPGAALRDSLPSSIYSAHTVTDKDCLLERFPLIRLYLKNIFSFHPR